MHKQSLYLACLIVSFGLSAKGQALKPFQQDAGPDGLVCVEAEHYDSKAKAPNNDEWVEVGPSGLFTGAAGMQAQPNNNNSNHNSPGYSTSSCRLDYQINFVKTGTYYIWIDGCGANGNDDSCHAGLDGLEISTCDTLSGWNGRYAWSNASSDGPRATFEVSSTGVHTLNIYMREDGFIVDRILLTTNPDYTPAGDGPGESPRGAPASALAPSPGSGATDVPREVILTWQPGPFAATHDVYFGTVLQDVTSANVSNPLGVLVSQGQDANTYDPPGRLEFGKTYYWRVDEVNAPPDSTIQKGSVWSFTVEPFVYQMTNITATASSSSEGVTPQNTVSGSGMNASEQHSMVDTTMWLSAKDGPQPTWIQYQFNGVYKLYDMRVWNYNIMVESIAGLGFKDVKIEYSVNGTDWTLLDTVQFAQGPGKDAYTFGTKVSFGGAAVKYVRLTPLSNWGGLASQYGLSEVRFSYIPANPRNPQPASGKTGVNPNTLLSWRPGREAASHEIYFSDHNDAVIDGTALVATVKTNSYDPAALNLLLAKTYYWKVVEVNETATPSAWAGDLWSFSTQSLFVVDDFESYTNDSPNRVFQTWIDGLGFSKDAFFPDGDPGNGSGAMVGYDPSVGDIMEKTIVHGGKQAMPVEYNNVNPPYYSEVDRTWDSAQNWTVNGADTLQLFFRGNPIGFEEKAGIITMSGAGADIWNAADEFTFAWKSLTGNATIIAKVENVENTDPWAKGGVMIRESLKPDSRFAAVYATPGNGVRYQARLLNAGSATSDTSVATPEQIALKTPVWIKLERNGTTFNGFYSTDGAKWTAMSWNPQTISMTGTVYIGLVVTSHLAGVGCTAQFSNVSIPSVSGAWQFAEIGVNPLFNQRASLYVALQDSAGHTGVVTHSNSDAMLLDTWQAWNIPLADFRNAGVNVTAIKKMLIGAGDRNKPSAGGAGTLFIDDIGYGRPAPVE